jgi:hypothetical protein
MRMTVFDLLQSRCREFPKFTGGGAPRQSKAFVNAFQKIRGVEVPSRDTVTHEAAQPLRCSLSHMPILKRRRRKAKLPMARTADRHFT